MNNAKDKREGNCLKVHVNKAHYSIELHHESNRAVGPKYRGWVSGAIPHVKFEVTTIPDLKIKYLEFMGFANIEAGDYIKVYLLKKGNNFEETEKVSKIEKLTRNERVLAVFEVSDFE